ncbi:ER membrane protein complex subunit 3-like, partial [Anneissia japonica]|uniref:ER membrane protein complex subunit 3-like n=1 Tax=Anneissia japonica TaxID=1529436 RepID=UPI0014257365
MAELLLDSNIRVWVVLPIVFITFFVGIIRHYVSILLQSQKKVELQQVSDGQALVRSRCLRENGRFIPKHSFNIRKYYFNDSEKGFFKSEKREGAAMKNPMTDPSMMTDMMKGNLTNILPMIIIGGWINWAFSGFVITKVPFPLTLRFKPMLQRGVELASLDASWVSSASWYFLNVFGLRSVYSLVLGENNGDVYAQLVLFHLHCSEDQSADDTIQSIADAPIASTSMGENVLKRTVDEVFQIMVEPLLIQN